jgi:HEAT repeat protein
MTRTTGTTGTTGIEATMRAAVLILSVAIVVPVAGWQQSAPPAPQIQNGKVERRPGTNIDRELAAVSSPSSTEPSWIAWKAPMVEGDRDMCSWYSDRLGTTRGMFIDDGMVYVSNSGVINPERPDRPQITPPKGPIPLEAGTNVVILARLIGGRVERLRTAGDDCPMDAGGRNVYWLEAITPAESIRFLAALAQAGPTDRSLMDADRQVAVTAVRAIGYHKDVSADAALDRIAGEHRESSVRRQAANTLTSLRGAHGVATVTKLLTSSKLIEERRSLTSALGQSREASAVPALRNLIGDEDATVRGEAVYYYIQRGGIAVVPEALKAVATDKSDNVRKRAISSIGRLPADAGVPQLLQIARAASTDAVSRKEAVNSLSQSKDPRAIAFMEEILKR